MDLSRVEKENFIYIVLYVPFVTNKRLRHIKMFYRDISARPPPPRCSLCNLLKHLTRYAFNSKTFQFYWRNIKVRFISFFIYFVVIFLSYFQIHQSLWSALIKKKLKRNIGSEERENFTASINRQ